MNVLCLILGESYFVAASYFSSNTIAPKPTNSLARLQLEGSENHKKELRHFAINNIATKAINTPTRAIFNP